MATFGGALIGTDTLIINNFASLIVDLTDPNAEWTLSDTLDINAVGGMLGGGGIQGSDFNMAGTATISGNSIWNAQHGHFRHRYGRCGKQPEPTRRRFDGCKRQSP